MKRKSLLVLLAAVSGPWPHAVAGDDLLTVHASTLETQIEPQDPERRPLRLPPMTFSLQAHYTCAAATAAAAISVSVADAHKRYVPAEGQQSITVTIDVPGSQLAPLASGDFCIRDVPDDRRHLELPGVASAQVSLRCESDSRASVRYASVPLAVRLECASPEDQEPPPLPVPAAR